MPDDRPDACALEAQFAYFAYRTLDCLPTLLAGSCRELPLLDANARWLARSVNLMLQHGDTLPEPEDVLPATEALTSLLFHACHADRARYPGHLREAYRLAFADDAAAARTPLRVAFERALDDYPHDLVAGTDDGARRAAMVRVQIRELAACLRDELQEAAAAPKGARTAARRAEVAS